MFELQTRDTPKSKWHSFKFRPLVFATREEAHAYGCRLDPDGVFDTLLLRIIEV